LNLKTVGYVKSPYKEKREAPHQGRNKDKVFKIELLENYKKAVEGLDKHKHLIVLYWQDKAKRDVVFSKTVHGGEPKGIFSTRSPNRPNPIALNIVDLISINDGVLTVKKMDALDGSPVIDIKPYIKELDCAE